VEFKAEVPGNYVLVDHALFRAFNKGALGILNVEGPEDHEVFSGKQEERDAKPSEQAAAPAAPPVVVEARTAGPMSLEAQKAAGEKVFAGACASCHMATGQGLPGVFPPLAKSDFLMADKARSIEVVTRGLSGPVKVNGTQYNSVMPPQAQLSDEDVANVLTFVRNNWGNKGDAVTAAEVKKVRGGGASAQAGGR